MQTTIHRAALGAFAGAAALTLALAGCGGSSATAGATTSATTATTAASTTPGTTAATTSAVGAPETTTPDPTRPDPTTSTSAVQGQVIEISVAGGKVTGPTGRVKVKQGSTVTLKVTSDVADEIHLHGYDKHVDVAKGGTATLTFKATLSGVFEAELESRGLQLVQLQVQ